MAWIDDQTLEDPVFRGVFLDGMQDALIKGGFSVERILKVLVSLLDKYGEDYLAEDIESRLNEKFTDLLSGRRGIQQEVEDLARFRGGGATSLSDFYVDLKLETKTDKQSCRTALNRLVTQGILEKIDSGRSGSYRMINSDKNELRFIEGDSKLFPVKLPFELNAMCQIYPKSIIVIAGSKSSGKTATLLTTALLNQLHIPVDYLNSDMGAEEYTARLKLLGCTCKEDVRFNAYDRACDFHDLITPEKKIFIIDFLEVHDNFYEIGKPIKQIWDRLRDGIAIIAIQMKQGATVGRGGDFSKEKARLYLAMDYLQDEKCTQLSIEEAKSPTAAFPGGVRGWKHKVKIINGSRFSPVDNWHE